jgi:hypothetical protein
VRDVGEADIEKSGVAETISSISTVCVRVPLVPLTVNSQVPGVAEALTLIVRVDVAQPPEAGVTEVGLRVANTSAGMPVTTRPTGALKPLRDVTFMVEVPEPP